MGIPEELQAQLKSPERLKVNIHTVDMGLGHMRPGMGYGEVYELLGGKVRYIFHGQGSFSSFKTSLFELINEATLIQYAKKCLKSAVASGMVSRLRDSP